MEIDIVVREASEEDRKMLREMFAHYAKNGHVRTVPMEDGRQKWEFFEVSASRPRVMRAILVVNVLYINNKEQQLDKNKRDVELAATIVNDTPKTPPKASPKPLELFHTETVRRDEVQTFITFWNERIWLPRIRGTDRQSQAIRHALSRPCFRDNYPEAIAEVAKSKFLRGVDGKRFSLSIDWFLEPENFDKILEGKYRDRQPEQSTPKYDDDTI